MYKRDTGVAVRVCDRLFDLQKNICQKIFDTRYITVTIKKKLSQIFENFGRQFLIGENMLVFSAEETPGQQPLAQLVRFVNL